MHKRTWEKMNTTIWDEESKVGLSIHPLINSDSPHYDTKKKSAIWLLEKELNVTEMIGFCKANIFKYKYRLQDKGQLQSDLKKIKTYEDYLEVLYALSDAGYFDDTVSLALEKSCIEFRYR